MRKFLIPIAAAASTLAVASPAAAQWAPAPVAVQWAPPVYQYQPYSYGTGFRYQSFANSMQARVQRIRNDIRVMDARNILSRSEARSLDRQARNVQNNIYRASRYGLQVQEARAIERQIRNLEYRVQREARDWNNRPGRRYR
ncbi:MAG TPA: hypothetical protein VIL42_09355 [Sphingomicrobium sp.]|jgi:hypothetical protein